MATISTRKNGNREIQFKSFNDPKKRETIRLGKVTKRYAEEVKRRVELIIGSIITQSPLDTVTLEWIASLTAEMRDRLARVGLCESVGATNLGQLVDQFFAAFSGADSTRVNLRLAADNLESHFGRQQSLRSIGIAEANKFRQWLRENGNRRKNTDELAETTVSRRCRRSRQIFKFAVEHGWIQANPFREMGNWVDSNPDRDHFVTRETYDQIIETSTSAEFRLVVAMSRIGGLRIPSEIKPMTWDCFLWDQRKIRIESPKTKRLGKPLRLIPLFPEIATLADELWGMAPDGELVFPNHQISSAAITDKLTAVLRNMGQALWPKPWNNMRASRETELMEQFPIHVATAWLGNSPKTALKHYSRIAKDHWDNATQNRNSPPMGENRAAPPSGGEKALQNALHDLTGAGGRDRGAGGRGS